MSDAELIALIDSVPVFAWLLLAAGVTVPYVMALYPVLRSRYYSRKLENRLARDAWMLQDELAEYESRIEDVPPINHRHIWISGLLFGVHTGLIVWAAEGDWPFYAMFAIMLGGLFLGIVYDKWRLANEPPPETDDESGEYGFARGDMAEMPMQAGAGLVGGILFVVVIVFFMMSL